MFLNVRQFDSAWGKTDSGYMKNIRNWLRIATRWAAIVMRQYIVSIIFVLSFYFSASAQRTISDVQLSKTDNLQSDSINNSDNREFEIKAGLKPIDKTQNSHEIRFYKTVELSGRKTLKVLYSTGQGWVAKRLTDLGDSIKVETLDIKDGQVRAAARVLFNFNLGYLPDQDKLETKMKKIEIVNGRQVEKKHLVSDGESYAVEFKHLDIYRIYRFNNPDVYTKLYPDIQEFKDYLSIVDTFEKMVK